MAMLFNRKTGRTKRRQSPFLQESLLPMSKTSGVSSQRSSACDSGSADSFGGHDRHQ
jgi:hypothetical protein